MGNKHTQWSSKRKPGITISVGRRLLFIFCGKCTEPYYFEGVMKMISTEFFKQTKGQTKLEYETEIDPVDPLNMARDVVSVVKKHGGKFEDVWVVFDKDSFLKDDFDNAIHSIKSLNKKNKTYYGTLWSNQCIELWFILHFEYLQSTLHRDDYFPKIGKHLNEKYKKADKNIFDKIIKNGGSVEFAMNNANKLLKANEEKTYSEKWPATNVVELFEKYKDYLTI